MLPRTQLLRLLLILKMKIIISSVIFICFVFCLFVLNDLNSENKCGKVDRSLCAKVFNGKIPQSILFLSSNLACGLGWVGVFLPLFSLSRLLSFLCSQVVMDPIASHSLSDTPVTILPVLKDQFELAFSLSGEALPLWKLLTCNPELVHFWKRRKLSLVSLKSPACPPFNVSSSSVKDSSLSPSLPPIS